MIQFHHREKSPAEDYTFLVDAEVVSHGASVLNLETQEKTFAIKHPQWLSHMNNTRVVKVLIVISLAITVAVLSCRVWIQDKEIRSLKKTANAIQSRWVNDTVYYKHLCKFEISDLRLGSYRSGKIGDQRGEECVSACMHMKVIDPMINAVTVFADPTKDGCWCERNVTSINKRYKSCFLPPRNTSKEDDDVADINTSEFVCHFEKGEGAGGTEVKIGNLKGNACINACLHLKQFDNTVNGVTVFAESSREGCWCEKGMRKVISLNWYKTCRLLPRYNSTRGIDTQICNFSIGYANDGTAFSVGKRTARQCVDDCLHMRGIDKTINGVTLNSKNGDCFCDQNMSGISGRYQTCFLKPENSHSVCQFVTGDGGESDWIEMENKRGDECVEACLNMKKIDNLVNGVTVHTDMTKGGCRCRRNMTTIDGTYRTCFLNTHINLPFATFNDPQPHCEFQKYGGSGIMDVYLGILKTNACINACAHLKKIDNSVDGVTMFSNSSKPGCWCEKGIRDIWWGWGRRGALYKSCKFKYASQPVTDGKQIASLCKLQDGSGVGNSLERAYIGKVSSSSECVEGCLHLRRIDASINGITMNGKRCWCERKMKTIGEYKTCIINNPEKEKRRRK